MSDKKMVKEMIVPYTTIENIPTCWKANEKFFTEWKCLVRNGEVIAFVEVK